MTTVGNHQQPTYLLEGVAKAYPAGLALAPTNLSVDQGERVAVLGPSGSGKTTLLHVMGGVIQPDEGKVSIHGRYLSDLKPGKELSAMVGMIHQQFDLVPHLSVIHNVLAGRLGRWSTLRSIFSLAVPQERHLALNALEELGIADKIDERTSRLSGGEQQRVAMARLLVQAPDVILADEPVASLDPTRAEGLVQLLVQVVRQSNRTLVASLHSVPLARSYFSRALGLRNGQLHFDLPIDYLTDDLLAELYDIKGLKNES